MVIERLLWDLSVCKVDTEEEIDLGQVPCFVGKTGEEISLVCQTERVPPQAIAREDGWRAFRIGGVLDFSLIGILAGITALLAENGIAVFALSTYNTDYVFLKREHYEKALSLLAQGGYTVV